ncbi:hypothetical protein LOAG_05687 [Loa loa]|uniref:Uncharacterized protein n=1 Tax=Loa loa TaxID=7209 RepID=A0A1S0TZ90_LOALO|nr:hypothetical protein LOAG_05687 [Loa loa]EFO22801.1 hypothetical protein LOAG_05687 [Loa loa]
MNSATSRDEIPAEYIFFGEKIMNVSDDDYVLENAQEGEMMMDELKASGHFPRDENQTLSSVSAFSCISIKQYLTMDNIIQRSLTSYIMDNDIIVPTQWAMP